MTIEPSLLTSLVADVTAQPGALPLFEYTLTELFESGDGRALRLAAYRHMGGLRGALAGRAELAFIGLSEAEQEVARQLLLRLITRSPTGEVTRRRVAASEIGDLDLDRTTVDHTVRTFARHGLLTFDLDAAHGERTIEISHDALLREWPRLADAIAEVEDDLSHHASLAAAVQEWLASGENPDYLLGGGRLSRYAAWQADSPMQLTAEEQRFLDLSAALEQRRQEERTSSEAQRNELEARARNRMRALVGLVAAVLLALGAFSIASFANRPPRILLIHEGEDAGFSELSVLGAQRASRELDVVVEDTLALTGYADALREAADSGFDVVMTSGISFVPALQEVAPDYPEVIFTINDADIDLPNVISLLYAEEEEQEMMLLLI